MTDLPTQPKNSKIAFTQTDSSLTFTVPPTGFFSGVPIFMLLFTVANNGIGWGLFFYYIARLPPIFIPVLALLPLDGIFFILLTIQLAKRKSVLTVTADALVFSYIGPLRKSDHRWNRADLTAILIGPSNFTVQGKPVNNLQILSKTQKPFGLFTGRDIPELEWLAASLRSFYNLPPSA